jgi:soluble lytic murein transglycosylase-like protein
MNKKNYYYIFFAIAAIGAFLFMKSDSDSSSKYDEWFIKYGNMYGVDWKMLKAIAVNESDLGENPRVKAGLVSSDGLTYGLMQMKFSTAKYYISGLVESDFRTNFEKQIQAAALFFADLKKKFNGDIHKMVISYNQGETNTKKGLDFTGAYYQNYLDAYEELS